MAEIAEETTDLSAVKPGPGMTVPRPTSRKAVQVEVSPGIMVSQRLIDEAVRQTSSETVIDFTERVRDADRQRVINDQAELRQDIDNSRTLVLEMLDRMRQPVKYDEKFVSYDTMPGPLKRVVKAYIEAEEANKNLSEVVAALVGDLKPHVTKPE